MGTDTLTQTSATLYELPVKIIEKMVAFRRWYSIMTTSTTEMQT